MVLFKRIDFNLDAELKRIAKAKYTKRQRNALLKLVDLFEKGQWQECLNHVNDVKAFPYNKKDGYDEKEHIGIEMSDILHGLAYDNYYTKEQLLNDAKAYLTKNQK